MSFTKVDICSQALALIRANSISSFQEDSEEAKTCSLLYDSFVKDIFSRYPWSFATKIQVLSRLAIDPEDTKYKYAYAMPNDWLRVLAVYDNNGNLIDDYEISGEDLANSSSGVKTPVLLANSSSGVKIKYTRYVEESNWPGYFINYAIHALADLLAGPITDDDATIDKMHRLAYGGPGEGERGGKFAVATYTDTQQQPSTEMDSNILIAARFA